MTPKLKQAYELNIEYGTDAIFSDEFETGNTSNWTSTANDGGDLSVSAEAAMQGSYGLKAVINDNNDLYVRDDTPNAETHYRARFYFDPNSIAMASGDLHYIFRGLNAANAEQFRITLTMNTGGQYELRCGIVNDAGSYSPGTKAVISDAAHAVEIEWQAATAAGANDGLLTMWIDGTQVSSQTGIDNDAAQIDTVRLGAVASVDTGTRGTEYFDSFESRRNSYIGPIQQGMQGGPGWLVLVMNNLWYWLTGSQTQTANLNSQPPAGLFQRLGQALTSAWQSLTQVQVAKAETGSATPIQQPAAVAENRALDPSHLASPPPGVTYRSYYFAGEQRVAMRVEGDPISANNGVFYILSDHLGGTHVVVKSDLIWTSTTLYKPWGETRYSNGSSPRDYLYTGQRQDNYINFKVDDWHHGHRITT